MNQIFLPPKENLDPMRHDVLTPIDHLDEWPRVRAELLRYVRRRVENADAAEDIVQDVLERMQRTDLPALSNVNAWLYRTATRLSVDRLRQRAVHARPVPGPTQTNDLESATASRQLLERLATAAEPDELQAAVLSRLDGMTHPEVAVVMSISERTVRRLLTRFDELAQRQESAP